MYDIYMVITTNSHSKILELSNHEQALSLYLFYYRHAKIQKTNQPWATIPFCMKGLRWGRDKVMAARKSLKSVGLIQDIRPGIGEKTYTKLNFITTEQTIHSIFDDPTENTHSRVNGNTEDDNSTNNDLTENTTCRGSGHKCLKSEKNKCLKSEKNKDKSLLNAANAACEKKGKVIVKKVRKRRSSKTNIAKPPKIIKPPKIAKPIIPAPDVSDRKVNKKKTASNSKIAKPKYNYNDVDEKYYIRLTNIDDKVIDHVDKTTKTYFYTMDTIHALFSKDCKSPLLSASNLTEELYDYVWTIDDVVEVFSFHLKTAPKPIKNIGQFIFNPGYGAQSKPSSQLIYWAKRLANGDDALSDKARMLYKNLKKKIEKTNSKHNIESFEKLSIHNLNNAATFLNEVEEEYEFITAEIGIRPEYGMISAFTTFIIKKMVSKGDTWKLGYITTEITRDEFIYEMKKGNTLTKKRKRGIDFNKKR